MLSRLQRKKVRDLSLKKSFFLWKTVSLEQNRYDINNFKLYIFFYTFIFDNINNNTTILNESFFKKLDTSKEMPSYQSIYTSNHSCLLYFIIISNPSIMELWVIV